MSGGSGEAGATDGGPSGEGASRATAVAPANIAFVKYWGARDLERAVPASRSISMTLHRCVTRCTVELRPDAAADEVFMAGEAGGLRLAAEEFADPVGRHVSRLRETAGRDVAVRVATRNSFPSSVGLASSASGFAALTLAAGTALGLDVDADRLSILARRSGSGSAARSTLGGYVEWPSAEGEDLRGPARRLAAADHWDLRDVVTVVDTTSKEVSSREGHRRAPTSPYFERRLELVPGRLEAVREAVGNRDLARLGPVLEEEAVDLHLVAMSSDPPIFYWSPGTLTVMEAVRGMREDGMEPYFTVDAGPNVHVICRPEEEPAVAERLGALGPVERVIRDRVGPGPRLDPGHLL